MSEVGSEHSSSREEIASRDVLGTDFGKEDDDEVENVNFTLQPRSNHMPVKPGTSINKLGSKADNSLIFPKNFSDNIKCIETIPGMTSIVIEFRQPKKKEKTNDEIAVQRDIFDQVVIDLPSTKIKHTKTVDSEPTLYVKIDLIIDALFERILQDSLIAKHRAESQPSTDMEPLNRVLFIDMGRCILYRSVIGGLKTANYCLLSSGENSGNVPIEVTYARTDMRSKSSTIIPSSLPIEYKVLLSVPKVSDLFTRKDELLKYQIALARVCQEPTTEIPPQSCISLLQVSSHEAARLLSLSQSANHPLDLRYFWTPAMEKAFQRCDISPLNPESALKFVDDKLLVGKKVTHSLLANAMKVSCEMADDSLSNRSSRELATNEGFLVQQNEQHKLATYLLERQAFAEAITDIKIISDVSFLEYLQLPPGMSVKSMRALRKYIGEIYFPTDKREKYDIDQNVLEFDVNLKKFRISDIEIDRLMRSSEHDDDELPPREFISYQNIYDYIQERGKKSNPVVFVSTHFTTRKLVTPASAASSVAERLSFQEFQLQQKTSSSNNEKINTHYQRDHDDLRHHNDKGYHHDHHQYHYSDDYSRGGWGLSNQIEDYRSRSHYRSPSSRSPSPSPYDHRRLLLHTNHQSRSAHSSHNHHNRGDSSNRYRSRSSSDNSSSSRSTRSGSRSKNRKTPSHKDHHRQSQKRKHREMEHSSHQHHDRDHQRHHKVSNSSQSHHQSKRLSASSHIEKDKSMDEENNSTGTPFNVDNVERRAVNNFESSRSNENESNDIGPATGPSIDPQDWIDSID